MKGPKVIIAKPFNNPDRERCYYFSEEAVRELLREEYEQANNIICFASSARKPLKEGIIEVEKSIESAISKLKAKINEKGGGMSDVQRICDSCLKSYKEITPTGNKVSFCRVDKMAHFGKLFCENRVGREEVKERAARIREFVANATDEQLVTMYM